MDIYTTFGKIIRSTGTSRNTSLIFDAEIVWKQTEFMECLARIFNNKNFTPFRTKHNYDLTDLKPEAMGSSSFQLFGMHGKSQKNMVDYHLKQEIH